MSMAQFVENVGSRLNGFRARGAEPIEIWVSDAGERVINEALMKERCADVDFIPCLRIHGVPVGVHKRMPPGHVWYVLKGGKK